MEICDLCDWCYVMIFQKGKTELFGIFMSWLDIKFSFESKTILIKHFMFSLIIRNEKLWWKFWQKLLFVKSKIKPSNICNWFLVSTLPVMGYLHWSLRKFAVRTNYCSQQVKSWGKYKYILTWGPSRGWVLCWKLKCYEWCVDKDVTSPSPCSVIRPSADCHMS